MAAIPMPILNGCHVPQPGLQLGIAGDLVRGIRDCLEDAEPGFFGVVLCRGEEFAELRYELCELVPTDTLVSADGRRFELTGAKPGKLEVFTAYEVMAGAARGVSADFLAYTPDPPEEALEELARTLRGRQRETEVYGIGGRLLGKAVARTGDLVAYVGTGEIRRIEAGNIEITIGFTTDPEGAAKALAGALADVLEGVAVAEGVEIPPTRLEMARWAVGHALAAYQGRHRDAFLRALSGLAEPPCTVYVDAISDAAAELEAIEAALDRGMRPERALEEAPKWGRAVGSVYLATRFRR